MAAALLTTTYLSAVMLTGLAVRQGNVSYEQVFPAPPAPAPAPFVETYIVDIEVRSGEQLLWHGPVRIGPQRAALIRNEFQEASAENCGARGNAGGGLAESRIAIRLDPAYGSGATGRMTLTVTWERAVGSQCDGPRRRTTALSESIILAAASAMTISGDGGLTVSLRRH